MSLKLRFILFLKLFCFMTLVLSFVPATSQDEEAESQSGWEQTQVPFNYQNLQVPRQTWQTIKDLLRQDGVKESVVEDFAVLPTAVQVDLMSENALTLKNSVNHRVTYVEGGGELDLFDFVVGKGSFYIRFSPEIDSGDNYHLIYISDSPGKELDGKQWGNGCGQIYDLTEKADLFIADRGMRVTSSRRHYLHLMAGTFLFFQLVDEKLLISYIRLKDSRYPNFTCRNT